LPELLKVIDTDGVDYKRRMRELAAAAGV